MKKQLIFLIFVLFIIYIMIPIDITGAIQTPGEYYSKGEIILLGSILGRIPIVTAMVLILFVTLSNEKINQSRFTLFTLSLVGYGLILTPVIFEFFFGQILFSNYIYIIVFGTMCISSALIDWYYLGKDAPTPTSID